MCDVGCVNAKATIPVLVEMDGGKEKERRTILFFSETGK
jgi:hypothetical protein